MKRITTPPLLGTLAARLVEAREGVGLTQEAFAKKAGVAVGTIGNLEAGTRKRPRDLLAIAAAAGVRPEWLETGKGPKYPRSDLAAADPELTEVERALVWAYRQGAAAIDAQLERMVAEYRQELASIEPGPPRRRLHALARGILTTGGGALQRSDEPPEPSAVPAPAAKRPAAKGHVPRT